MKDERNKTDEQLYRLISIDFCSPAFVSFESTYYGTTDAILAALSSLKRPDMLQTAEPFFANKYDGRVKVLYQTVPFLQAVERIEEKHFVRAPGQYVFKNIWGFDYVLRSDRVIEDYIYLRTEENKYVRSIRLRSKNLQIKSSWMEDAWAEPHSFWGHPGVLIKHSDGVIENRLLVWDLLFETEEEMQRDIKKPKPCNYNVFFAEIFGDG